MIGLSRAGAIRSSPSNGVTNMPEMPASAARKPAVAAVTFASM
jgi:hypothetical protein